MTLYLNIKCTYSALEKPSAQWCFVVRFKLKTIHEEFNAMLHCNFDKYLWRHDAGKVWHTCRADLITLTYITNTCACVGSPRYLVWIVYLFSNCYKTLLHVQARLRSLYNVLPTLKMCHFLRFSYLPRSTEICHL